MKKLIVDKDACIGCGNCVALDEEHFTFDDATGLSKVISNNNIETELVHQVIDSCPTGAIRLEDDECNCEHCDCEDCNCTK